jgi:iron complex transport system ATP-binding protein
LESAPSVPVLSLERVALRPAGATRDVVRDLSLGVHAGEILALVGPNGSGKSTTLAALGGELRPREGVVRLEGVDIRKLGRRALARRVARLPQSPGCAEGLTVEEVVACGRHPHRSRLRGPSAQDQSALRAALRWMELEDLRQRSVETLSGGERRRTWLAMTLAQDADVLLLDEPTAALDLRHQHEVGALLRRMNVELGTTIVVVFHDLVHAVAVADRVAVMHRGRLYGSGPASSCIDAEMLRDVFGVEAEVQLAQDELRLAIRGLADPKRRL